MSDTALGVRRLAAALTQTKAAASRRTPKNILISIRMTLVMLVLTCGIYPLAVYAVAQLAFPHQANGSFLYDSSGSSGGAPPRNRATRGTEELSIGSELIGQSFTSPKFFHSRPSASDYDATNSGGTNLGPTSKKLRDAKLAAARSYGAPNPPEDAITSSASGLDPDISPENAYAQAPRVAQANGVSVDAVRALIARNIEPRFLGVFGARRVNVLRLNLQLGKTR